MNSGRAELEGPLAYRGTKLLPRPLHNPQEKGSNLKDATKCAKEEGRKEKDGVLRQR